LKLAATRVEVGDEGSSWQGGWKLATRIEVQGGNELEVEG
jgi:hypothetical protein